MGKGRGRIVSSVILSGLFCSGVMATPIESGLVAYWTADTTAEDATANAHDGTLMNGAGYGTGISGAAFSLDGYNDYVSVPDSADWTFSGDFSINLWVNFSSTQGGTIGSPDAVFVGHDEGGGFYDKWFFALGGGYLNFHINGPDAGGSQFLAQTAFNPTPGVWYNLGVQRSEDIYMSISTAVQGPLNLQALPFLTRTTLLPSVGVRPSIRVG